MKKLVIIAIVISVIILVVIGIIYISSYFIYTYLGQKSGAEERWGIKEGGLSSGEVENEQPSSGKEIDGEVVCSIETQGIECCTDIDCSVIEVCNISLHFCYMQDPIFIALSEKIGKDDAESVASLLPKPNFTLTEEFIDEFLVDYSPGYDADNDITIIGDSEAPSFLKIAEMSLDNFYDNSPEFYQYAIEELRHIRGENPGSRCGGAQVEGNGMLVNTYNYIYDYKDVPLDEQPLIYSFLFIHEATHIKVKKLRQSEKIKQLTTAENEAIAYLAHGYYAKTYDSTGQTVLVGEGRISLKEFVITWTTIHSNVHELPEDYIWDWDFYVTVLEKAGFPPEDLDKLIVELNSSD